MNMDTRPRDGVGVQARAQSFLSVFLSILFVIPTGVSWPVSVEALTAGAEDTHSNAAALPKDKKAKPDAALSTRKRSTRHCTGRERKRLKPSTCCGKLIRESTQPNMGHNIRRAV